MNVVSVREHPEYKQAAIRFFQDKCAAPQSEMVYENCIRHALLTEAPLPQWYLLEDEDDIIGCAGLVPNDFISRMDLWPWICALYIDPAHQANEHTAMLLDRAKQDARAAGFRRVYLRTDRLGFYEQFGFTHIGTGYHPWGESSMIYACSL